MQNDGPNINNTQNKVDSKNLQVAGSGNQAHLGL